MDGVEMDFGPKRAILEGSGSHLATDAKEQREYTKGTHVIGSSPGSYQSAVVGLLAGLRLGASRAELLLPVHLRGKQDFCAA